MGREHQDYDEEPLTTDELADIREGLEAMRRGEYVTLEELERKRRAPRAR